jgi:low affinity Fe/Cu permease
MMRREIPAIAALVIILVGILLWAMTGRQFRQTGFGPEWSCPPNATPASTVCIKNVKPAN